MSHDTGGFPSGERRRHLNETRIAIVNTATAAMVLARLCGRPVTDRRMNLAQIEQALNTAETEYWPAVDSVPSRVVESAREWRCSEGVALAALTRKAYVDAITARTSEPVARLQGYLELGQIHEQAQLEIAGVVYGVLLGRVPEQHTQSNDDLAEFGSKLVESHAITIPLDFVLPGSSDQWY